MVRPVSAMCEEGTGGGTVAQVIQEYEGNISNNTTGPQRQLGGGGGMGVSLPPLSLPITESGGTGSLVSPALPSPWSGCFSVSTTLSPLLCSVPRARCSTSVSPPLLAFNPPSRASVGACGRSNTATHRCCEFSAPERPGQGALATDTC